MGTNEDYTESVAVQPDGKIVVGGTSNFKFAVVRYDQNGNLDTSFNTTGIAVTTVGSSSFCTDMYLDTNGKILLAGNIIHDFGCIRYNTDGTVDSAFGTNGKYSIDFGGSSYDYGRALARQADGKFVIGGMTSFMCSNRAFALTRFSIPNLSVAESEKLTVTIYPNPTYDCVTIASKNTMKSVAFYTISGQLVAYQQVNDLNARIEVSHLSRGLYLAKINTDAGVVTHKITKE